MARCNECGYPWATINYCSQCHSDDPRRTKNLVFIGEVILVIIGIFIIVGFFKGKSKSEFGREFCECIEKNNGYKEDCGAIYVEFMEKFPKSDFKEVTKECYSYEKKVKKN
jgi:hypothetical protein